jgi:protein-S-isoprenylcysteine O-methyltransferase Ste14
VIAWGVVIAHVSMLSVGCGALVLAGGLVRMLCEERLLKVAYPDYTQYMGSTKRMIPFIF